MIKFAKLILVVSFVLFSGAEFNIAYAQSDSVSDRCSLSDKLVNLYGETICPDKYNDLDDFAAWDSMRENLREILPAGFGEETKNAPALCEHIKILHDKYGQDAEIYMFKLQSSMLNAADKNPELAKFISQYRGPDADEGAPADLTILKLFLQSDKNVMKKLLSFYSDEAQVKILMVKNLVDRANHLAVLYDSALDNCPDYAAMMGYYKVINYNGPDAGYDPNDPVEAKKWKALEEKWAQDKAKQEKESK
ncbi:MAG: hypothetical protein GW778_01605 [Alphaproteobacteria bacterium]|nr:hypothetical protein [Alphaproteobacteria bacterium]